MSLDSPIVEMANCQDDVNLNKGPGHINGTALPGAAGNCVIAGHRSTYTRPFALMGSLQDGDEIILVQPSGVRRAYKVRQIWVVNPNDVSVLDPTPEPSVTLITCHPVGSDASRLIIRAVLSS
jgi:sortase A